MGTRYDCRRPIESASAPCSSGITAQPKNPMVNRPEAGPVEPPRFSIASETGNEQQRTRGKQQHRTYQGLPVTHAPEQETDNHRSQKGQVLRADRVHLLQIGQMKIRFKLGKENALKTLGQTAEKIDEIQRTQQKADVLCAENRV